MANEDNNRTRRRNLTLGAILIVAALSMYFGIFVKMY